MCDVNTDLDETSGACRSSEEPFFDSAQRATMDVEERRRNSLQLITLSWLFNYGHNTSHSLPTLSHLGP